MAKKNITPNKERMYSYAKNGGLNGFRNGGGVLDKKQLGGIVKALKPIIKKAVAKAGNSSSLKNLPGEWVDKGKLPIKESTLNDFLNETPKKVVKKVVKNK